MGNRILVVGSINMDLTIQAPRQPVMGETISGGGFQASPGGKGANQAAACARLGAEVKMIGCVGSDIYGDTLLNGLAQNGVDVQAVERIEGSSGIAVITVCDGDNCIVLDEGANARVTAAQLQRQKELFSWADVLLLQLEIPVETTLAAAELAHSCGTRVITNPAPMKPFDPRLLQATDLFIPNRTEAETLLEHPIKTIDEAQEAARELRAKGPEEVIITMGSQGAVYCGAAGTSVQGIFPTKVVDTTAAGDSFIAGLAAFGGETQQAMRFASAVSALAVSRAGAQASLPTRSEVDDFLAMQ